MNSFDNKLLEMTNGFENMFTDLKQKILSIAKDTFSEMSVASKDVSSKAYREKLNYANIVSIESMIVVKPKNTAHTNAQGKSDIITECQCSTVEFESF
ncbi:hypothetical protein WA026_004271 [Henosepilachna vigintioctopunctata]|uniref:Uncharacterized protein n=1 Tax=Henosepilachna vigintioctopunctata TaxID=420089 RepID=A0AAW1V016_9CUCU